MKAIFPQLLFLLLCCYTSNAQSLFPDKFDDCSTERFSTESGKTSAQISNVKLLKVFEQTFGEEKWQKLKGTLTMQIIVDLEGRSCLLSLKNETNIKTADLDIKKGIDLDLVWLRPTEKIGAIVSITFGKKPTVKRYGLDAKRGFHELVD
jgi:hypothetical protein